MRNDINSYEVHSEMRLFNIEELIRYMAKYPTITKRWFTPSELNAYMTIEIEHQARLRGKDYVGRIPYAKVGKMVRYDKEDIDSWLCEHKVHSVLD